MYDIRYTFFCLFWHMDVDNTFSTFCCRCCSSSSSSSSSPPSLQLIFICFSFFSSYFSLISLPLKHIIHRTIDVGGMNFDAVMKLTFFTPFYLILLTDFLLRHSCVWKWMRWCSLKMLIVNTFQFKLPIQDVYLICVSIWELEWQYFDVNRRVNPLNCKDRTHKKVRQVKKKSDKIRTI